MIVTKLISGLGNQLFQYAVGRHLSLMHDTELKIDASFFDEQNFRSYKLNHYNIKGNLITQKELSAFLARYRYSALVDKIYRRLEPRIPKRYHRYFREKEWWVYEPELFHTGHSVCIDGYWQHYKYFENIHPRIFEELTLVSPYPIEAQSILYTIESDLNSVALHIRRGDYVTDVNAQKMMGVLPLDYYNQAIGYIKTKVKKPTFYIFSDDLQWAAENLRLDAPMILVDVAEGKLDYIELDLISKCRHAIIANSSFSWWGAFLNRNPDKVVVAPAQWVAVPDINQRIKIQLPSWKLL